MREHILFPVAKHFGFILNANVDAFQIDPASLFPCLEVNITFRLVLLSTSFLELLKLNALFLSTVAEKLPLVC